MKNCLLFRLFGLLIFSSVFISNISIAQTFNYPPTPKQPVTDTIFGKVVVDDYRWMEDMNSQQMKDWLKTQADYTNNLLDKIPGRNVLIEELKMLDALKPSNIVGVIRKENRYFYIKTLAGESTGKLYFREEKSGKDNLLFDPNSYKNSSESSINFNFLPSNDGKKILLFLSEKGSEVYTNRILNVDTKELYPEIIYPGSIFGSSFATTWTPDSKGIFFTVPLTTDHLSKNFLEDSRTIYHEIGTDPEKDKLILSREKNQILDIKPQEIIQPAFSPDNKYILVTILSGRQNESRKFYAPTSDLLKEDINWKPLIKADDNVQAATIYKENVYIISRKDAPKGKVLMTPLHNFDLSLAKTIIPETGKNIENFTDINLSKNFLFVPRTDGINSQIDKYNVNTGELKQIKLPFSGITWVTGFNIDKDEFIIDFISWSKPSTRYDYDALTEQLKLSAFNTNINYPGTNDLVVEEVEAPGHDGVMVPLSLIYNKNLKKDGSNVVYMSGYGSYGSSLSPWFRVWLLTLLNRGVIIAQTHPRGGGEKGNEWHMAGFKTTKPNTWKDFISCAEYLIENKYSSPNKIIGEGGSAGGILIGRAITERPDLFTASVHSFPVSNAYRHENRTVGDLDAKEFGTIKDSVEAMALMEMDAYLHVKNRIQYPAVLAVAGINDSRVPAWQPGKLVAAMQSASASDKPILLLIDYDSGHGTVEKSAQFLLLANNFAFALWQAGHKDFQPVKETP